MTFDDQLKRAFDTLTERLRDELDRQVHAAMGELSTSARLEADAAAAAAMSAVPPPPEAVAAPVPLDAGVDQQRLLNGIRAIDAGRSLTDILDALIGAAAHEHVGAGVWLLRGGSLRYWRSTGIATPPGDIGLDDAHEHHREIAEAARTNERVSHDGIAMPLALASHVVAVLWVRADEPNSDSLSHAAVEVLARHAAKALESLTAFKTARAMADRAATDNDAQTSAPATLSAPAPEGTDTEEHVSAQRYARLLVSEIKLYHEQAMIEGRRDRDLAVRLGGEIARARVMYEQRVPAHIRQRADHFHAELVRTLANGDASLIEQRA